MSGEGDWMAGAVAVCVMALVAASQCFTELAF